MVGLACSESIRQEYIDPRCSPPRNGSRATVPGVRGRRWPGRAAVRDPQTEAEFASFVSDLDALVVCHGSPFVSHQVLDAGPRLSLLGELEGDRFGYHFDTTAAAERGLSIVDTTHGSSWPTAEWALGLALIGRRNAGALFRKMIAHEHGFPPGGKRRGGPGYDGPSSVASGSA